MIQFRTLIFLRSLVQVLKSKVSMHAALTAALTPYFLDLVFSLAFSPNLCHRKINPDTRF